MISCSLMQRQSRTQKSKKTKKLTYKLGLNVLIETFTLQPIYNIIYCPFGRTLLFLLFPCFDSILLCARVARKMYVLSLRLR